RGREGQAARFARAVASLNYDQMQRRAFLVVLGGAAAFPLVARAPQPSPTIGFLHAAVPRPFAAPVAAFRDGLREAGYVEGRNMLVEYRWAENRYDRLPALAADLAGRRVAVIAAFGDIAPGAARAAAPNVPIVFMVASDPVKAGLVPNLNRPG